MPPALSSSTISPTGSLTRTVSFAMFLFGWTAALATLLGFFANVWWPLDFLADWRLVLAVVLFIAAVVTGFGYSRSSAIVFLVAAITNAVLIAPMWLEEQAPLSSSDRIRVVSLDIGFSPDVRPDVIEWVTMVEGDIVVLANAGGTWARAIEQLDVPYRVVNDDPGLTGGTVVLARTGIAATIERAPSGMSGVDIVVSVPLGDEQLKIFGLSVERPVNGSAWNERLEQFAAINSAVLRMTGPAIIVGNLEASRWSKAFSAIATDLTNSEDGFGYLSTFPASDWPLVGEFAGIPVDHALYRGAITVTNRRVSPDLGTDHRALVVDLSPATG